MNPALRTDPRLLRLLGLEALPAQSRVDWRVRLAETMAECGGEALAQHGGAGPVDAVLEIFQQIFVYSPRALPTADGLAHNHFWGVHLS